jgi:hypothetical protein
MPVEISDCVVTREIRGNMQENGPSTQSSESNLETFFMRNDKIRFLDLVILTEFAVNLIRFNKIN